MMTYEDAERLLCNQCIHHVHCMIHDKECEPMKTLKRSQWIPCSERLPEDDGRYLCFWGTGVMQVFKFSNDLYAVDDYDFAEYKGKKEKGFYDYNSEYGYAEIDWITAWMSLPEPYKEETK